MLRARDDVHVEPVVTAAPALAPRESLPVLNLHNTLPELAGLVVTALEGEDWLDAYLLAAGMGQLIDDYLEPDPLALRRISSFLAKDGGAAGRALAAGATRPGANALARISAVRPSAGTVQGVGTIVETALERLAELVLGAEISSDTHRALQDLMRASELIHGGSTRLSHELRDDIVRLPACFRSFDQHPDDLRALSRAFRGADPQPGAPVLVVGIRTSGSYMAPLLAACLRAEGYGEVAAITMRPGRRAQASRRAMVRAIGARGGSVLLCDDPPGTGASIARAAGELVDLGIAPEQIVLVLALFAGERELPPSLAGFRSVVLPYEDWSIHERLSAHAVRSAADVLLGDGCKVTAAECLATRAPRNGRGHLKGTFALRIEETGTQQLKQMQISVEGVGLGYFGHHATAVAAQLREFLPPLLGVRDGLLLRSWMPDEARADRLPAERLPQIAARVAGYVFARNRRLGIPRDVTLRQSGQYPAWEAASTVLSHSFGRAWPLGRTLITDRAVKRLLRVRRPCVVDGRVTLSQWFSSDGPDDLVKVDWDQGASWNLGLGCCDPVFDLAGMTAAGADPALGAELRSAYASLDADAIDDERWLLYELAHLSAPDAPRESRHALWRARSRAVQRYFRRVYFEDLTPAADGPLCGLDLDGVLETEHLGFPALRPASARGLRALVAHGFRPLIVTGRSAADLVERCQNYGLAGGVAEYGCVTFNARDALVEVIATPEEQRVVDRLRAELGACDGVTLDEDYTHAIRAFVRDARGARGPVPADLLAEARRAADAQDVSLIVGDEQTDVVHGSIDKGRGTLAIAASLVGDRLDAATPLAFAMGDTTTDLPLLRLARAPFAPAHAKAALGAVATVTRSGYQLGFAEAVEDLVGHAPGGCAQCALRPPTRERRLLLGLLGLGERGMGRIPVQVAKLAGLA